MPTTLPARRPLSAEYQEIAARLDAVDRLAVAAPLDPAVRLRTLLRARLSLWLIRRQIDRLERRDRFPPQR